MLLHIQKPGSKYVASASDWWKRFRRKPKPGARPLVILRPFGPVAFVYELEDTEGEQIPIEVEKPFKAKGDIKENNLKGFIHKLYLNGFYIHEENYGTEFAGQVQIHNETGYFINHDTVTKLATIYHELGHVYCGHLYNPEIKYLPQRCHLPTKVEEFEAESVCYMLCERQGIKNPSAEYLSNYLDKNGEIPNISLDTVLKAVAAIERIREKDFSAPREELLMKY